MFARAGGAAAPHGSPPKGSGHVPYDVLVGALRALPNPPFVISNSLGVAVMSGGTVLSGEAPSQRVSLPMGHSLAIFDAAPRPEADPAFDTTSSLVHIDDLPFPAWKACDTSFITNTAWKQTTGFGSIGEWIRAIHPDDAAAAADFMASAARRSLIDATYRVRVASGELLHFNIKAQPVFGLTRGVGPPPIAYMVGISNNITGHKVRRR